MGMVFRPEGQGIRIQILRRPRPFYIVQNPIAWTTLCMRPNSATTPETKKIRKQQSTTKKVYRNSIEEIRRDR